MTDQPDAASLEVVHEPTRHRYELRLDGRLAGLADYTETDDVVAITHTEVDPERGGRGLGTRLVRAALDDLRARHKRVVPACPFVAVVIRRYPEYADLLAEEAHPT